MDILFSFQIKKELETTKSDIAKSSFKIPESHNYLTELPNKGMGEEELLATLRKKYTKIGKQATTNQQECWESLWKSDRHIYHKAPIFAGTSFSAPQSITEKPMEVYYLDELILLHCMLLVSYIQ